MTSRDQTIALILIGVMTLAVGAVGGYMFVWEPIQANERAKAELQDEIGKLEKLDRDQTAKAKQLAVQRTQSLPADQTIAKQEYFVALERLTETAIKTAEAAGVPKGEMKSAINVKVVDNTSRSVPEVTKGKPVYTKIAYTVTIQKADMWVIRDVLRGYYDLDVLHQITNFSIKKDEDTGKGVAKRNDLKLEFTTEAIIVDGPTTGPQYRRTLIQVPTAFGAIGGGPLYQIMGLSTETGRGASSRPAVPVLATKSRDYSLIVLKDPFNGPLPPPPSFKLAPVKNVTVVQDEKPAPVKVAVSGEGAIGTKVRAVASGTLFPEGELKVDPKTLAIELPKTSLSEGTATVAVIATSADGKVEETSFKVTVTEKEAVVVNEPKRDDVSGAIILTMLTIRHADSTASAAIRDGANRQRYEIEVSGKKVLVSKFYYIKDKKKADDTDDTGMLVIADDNSKTKRTFRVIAVNGDGLLLEDTKSGSAKLDVAPKPVAKGPGGPRPFGPPKQGPANPVAALGGNVANGVSVAPAAVNKVYRWTVGQSLATITLVPEDEAKKLLKQAADNGPMLEVVAVDR